ncbi:radical SAM family heme chaperone HemW [Cytophagaceae bacterium ABcell3]|nr:radical SAM family heme chaperone HemW [Cytophagaceae bacterium ABcell3]
MSGLYIHIPFCRQACHYCNFHFSTNLKVQEDMVRAICLEMEMRRNYLGTKIIKTIYFGGGTPSLLTDKQIDTIFNTINKYFSPSDDVEITLEANPDDLTKDKLSIIKNYFNRLSIGVQSFDQENLRFMNRLHTSTEAENCIKEAQQFGLNNISIDLIYGIPGSNLNNWQKDLNKAITFNVPHLSCYGFTIEQGTVFGNWLKKGKLKPVEDEEASEQFDSMIHQLELAGYEHYEISNFALPGMYSKHNTSYWQDVPYLGLGPGAHSYNNIARQYNVSNNHQYITAINQGRLPNEEELLSETDKINEYILTTLRTTWGMDMQVLIEKGYKESDLTNAIAEYKEQGYVELNEGKVKLTPKGKIIADKITLDLIIL